MLSAYPACFFQEETGYSVIFPDLNYLSTCGESLEDALSMAIDCLAGYLYTERKEGAKIPAPSAIETIDLPKVASALERSEYYGFVNIVAVDVNEYAKLHFEKSVKKTLSIPAWLNTAALEQGINFSAVLQNALKQELHLN